MKKFFTLLTSLFLVSLISVSAQNVTLDTYGVSPREAEMDTTDIFDLGYNAMTNVGKETTMYLVGKSDTTLAAPMWTVAEVPTGSASVLGMTQDLDSASQAVVFVPDLVGKYVIIFADGAASDTLIINAGLYLGAKTGSPNCWMCHNETYTKWEGTGHADIFTRAMNGTLSDHYGSYCVKCHTTGYDYNAENDGFDDRDWVYPSGPDSLNEGTWDSLLVTSPLAMQLANIQCEACHGPGSEHNGDVTDSKMVSSLDVENCGICHDSGPYHAFPAQWKASGQDATFYDHRGFHGGHAIGAFVGYTAARGNCVACHNGAGYVQWVKEGKPTDDIGLPGSIEYNPEPELITCAVCHDPHDGSIEHQLRATDTQLGDGTPVTMDMYGTGAQCMECHRSRRDASVYASTPSNSSHYGPHHGPQADMLIGANYPDWPIELPSSAHAAGLENACVDCHMYGDGVTDENGDAVLLGGHSFNMNDTEGNDHVEACVDCHGDVGTTFKEKKYYWNGNADHDGDGVEEGLQVEVTGMMEELDMLITAADTVQPRTVPFMQALYAYMWVFEDRSLGIHNPAFTVAMLQYATELLKYQGITAGAIQSVMDIPMDQGFQVRLVWTAFGADDGVAMDAVKSYTILRKAADAAPAKGVVEYPTVTQIPSDVEVGTSLALAGELWDVVKEVEAIQYIEYSAVVPTLYNTVEGDTAWATFKVLGKSEAGMIAETEPMDGYSTDDLAPVPPANLTAELAGDGVELMWEDPVDTDFSAFEVYKSETQGFVPAPEFLIATTSNSTHTDMNVEQGKTYYYVVTAKDFSNNVSEASNEAAATITDVGEDAGIPTEYALNQNYPNPFNPSTAIKFAIPDAANVSLVIYDMLGNQVDVLVNNNMSAGYYTFTWNASNYASGIYFCQMKANDFIQVNKMLLIK